MLEVEGLGVDFGGVRALADVDMAVPVHGIAAIVGPNGAGKTTLLNAVNGFLRGRLSGTVRVGPVVTTSLRPAELARIGVARSFQEPRLVDRATVLDNVLSGAHVTMRHGVLTQLLWPRRAAREEAAAVDRARELLAVMDLGGLAGAPVSELSYGHRKLVDIARAVMRRPELLLLDEPSSGLDEKEQDALAETLRRLHDRERTTVVLVEHHMSLVRAVADEVVAMQAGRVVTAGPTAVVLDSQEFKDALVGAVHPQVDEVVEI